MENLSHRMNSRLLTAEESISKPENIATEVIKIKY
jgi:hypothetical protein